MTELHITKVVPFPARVLAVLADEPGQRVLPASNQQAARTRL